MWTYFTYYQVPERKPERELLPRMFSSLFLSPGILRSTMFKEFRRVKAFSVFRRKEFCEGKHDARIVNFVLNLAFSVRDEGDGVKRTGRVTYNGNVRFDSLFLFRFGKMANTFYLPPPPPKKTNTKEQQNGLFRFNWRSTRYSYIMVSPFLAK